MADEDNAVSAMRQKLMSADECYVYKIPPLKTAGGHRAEDWNLSKPLQTCSLLVERRGDALFLDFEHEGKLFAQAQTDLTRNPAITMSQFVEQVADSSRYFVVKIQGGGGREAMIGFGFRDREKAVDLKESLQHYEKSIRRESEASSDTAHKVKIPVLGEGEKIHVNLGGKSKASKKEKSSTGEGSSKAVPLLSKKPPPPANSPEQKPKETVNPKTISKVAISMGDIDLDADARRAKHSSADDDDEDDDDDSGGAVYEGDEQQWATEFEMK